MKLSEGNKLVNGVSSIRNDVNAIKRNNQSGSSLSNGRKRKVSSLSGKAHPPSFYNAPPKILAVSVKSVKSKPSRSRKGVMNHEACSPTTTPPIDDENERFDDDLATLMMIHDLRHSSDAAVTHYDGSSASCPPDNYMHNQHQTIESNDCQSGTSSSFDYNFNMQTQYSPNYHSSQWSHYPHIAQEQFSHGFINYSSNEDSNTTTSNAGIIFTDYNNPNNYDSNIYMNNNTRETPQYLSNSNSCGNYLSVPAHPAAVPVSTGDSTPSIGHQSCGISVAQVSPATSFGVAESARPMLLTSTSSSFESLAEGSSAYSSLITPKPLHGPDKLFVSTGHSSLPSGTPLTDNNSEVSSIEVDAPYRMTFFIF